MAKSTVTEGTLSYPMADLRPEDFLHFIELDEFVDDWKALGFDVEVDLFALQATIMANPTGPSVIPGTGGLRKLRFARAGDSGKRSGVRVCYAYFPKHWTVLLVLVYGKNEQADLTPSECEAVKRYLSRAAAYFDKQNY